MNLNVYRTGVPSLFRDVFGEDLFTARGNAGREAWTPAVDIFEKDHVLTFEFDLPGIDKKDLKVSFKEGVLTVSSEVTQENKTANEKEENTRYFACERCRGAFSRSFRLGDAYDATQVDATYRNGVLTVTIPKREDTRPVSITVK